MKPTLAALLVLAIALSFFGPSLSFAGEVSCTGYEKTLRVLANEERTLAGFARNKTMLPGRISNQREVLSSYESGGLATKSQYVLATSSKLILDYLVLHGSVLGLLKFKALLAAPSKIASLKGIWDGAQIVLGGYGAVAAANSAYDGVNGTPGRAKEHLRAMFSDQRGEITKVVRGLKAYDALEEQLNRDLTYQVRKYRMSDDERRSSNILNWGRHDGMEWATRIEAERLRLELLKERLEFVRESRKFAQASCGPTTDSGPALSLAVSKQGLPVVGASGLRSLRQGTPKSSKAR